MDCFCARQEKCTGKHVTQCLCRRGPYLPTVPELTHMPLCWRFSRSLEPDKDARGTQRWSRWSRCLSKGAYKVSVARDLCPVTSSPPTSPRCLLDPASHGRQRVATGCCGPGVTPGVTLIGRSLGRNLNITGMKIFLV